MKVWRVLRWFVLVLVLLVVGVAAWAGWHVRDRHRGYELNLFVPEDPNQPASQLEAGFGKASITPEGYDWAVDVDGNARYEPAKGDSFVDVNGNGRFDPIWLAGFHNDRAAAGVHDDIWARAMVLDDGRVRLALVALDAIGFMHDDVVDVRELVPEEWGIDQVVIHAIHDHEVPDLIGIWGRDPFHSGVDSRYRRFVHEAVVKAIGQAVDGLRPTVVTRWQIDEIPEGLAVDTRPPYVYDLGVRVLRFVDAETGDPQGSLLAWANHPEALGSDNLLITADFVGYFRDYVERGVVWNGEQMYKGLGGIAVYVNGALGGLLTPLHTETVHPFTGEKLTETSFEKADAIGLSLAIQVLANQDKAVRVEAPVLSVAARTFKVALSNPYFQLGGALGVLERGWAGWKKLRTEVDLIRLGEVAILCIPGEIYPEIVVGGIEHPAGADFDVAPVEVPPLFDLLEAKMKILVGLANDEIGYIIPQSEWDQKPPYLYNAKKSPYGEINSLGPETGPTVYAAVRALLEAYQQWESGSRQRKPMLPL